MLASLCALSVLAAKGPVQENGDARFHNPALAPRPGQKVSPVALYWLDRPMSFTKLSPKKFGPTQEPYTFDWVVAGFVRPADHPENQVVRFRIYNQLKPKENDETFGAARMLLRLWETLEGWGSDHSYDYAGGTVDLYLCWGGTPGGEALLDHDPQVPKTSNDKVATMYIYDLPSFKDPVERAREVAHEYGHLVLPAVGGYSDPEDWANGVLGERLFLTQLARDLRAGEIPSEDVFGVTAVQLDAWLAKNVVPYRDRAALQGPFAPAYARRDKAGMDAFIGEASLLQAMLPSKRLGRTLRLMESQKAEALIKSAPISMEEGGATLTIPASLAGKAIWIPMGRTKVVGAKVLARRSGWAQVKPTGSTVTLKV